MTEILRLSDFVAKKEFTLFIPFYVLKQKNHKFPKFSKRQINPKFVFFCSKNTKIYLILNRFGIYKWFNQSSVSKNK